MDVIAALDVTHAWYMLRVDPRRPSVGGCPVRKINARAQRPLPVRVDGASALPEPRQPLRAEFLVEAALLRRGIEAWVPVESRFNRHNRFSKVTKVVVYQPILTGYVLARLAHPVRWGEVMACPMVRGVMGFGGVPARLPESGVARLRAIEAGSQARAHHRMMPTGRVFEIGEVVEILDGSMEGQRAEVLSISGETARVFCKFFGSEIAATIGLEKIGAVA